MRYSIGICLGLDAMIASAGGYIAACCLAEDRLDPQLAPLLYSDLPEYNGEQADGCLSWIRCTQLVAAEYGIHGQCLQPVAFAEPFNYPRYIAALPEECEWHNGVIDLAVNVQGREPTHLGIFEPWHEEPQAFDVRGRL